MKPIRIKFDPYHGYALDIGEIKYTFATLLTLCGIPWHFLPDTADEPVDIHWGRAPRGKCRLFIQMTDLSRDEITTPQHFSVENGTTFLHFAPSPGVPHDSIQHGEYTTNINNDIILTSYYLLTGWQERYSARDRRDRPCLDNSFFDRNQLLHTPIVNQYALIIRKLFGEKHGYIPSWPGQKRYAIALTHDVDYPVMIRWIEALRYLAQYKGRTRLKQLTAILKGEESFWQFGNWIELEQAYRFKSTFFFCGFQGSLLRYLLHAPDPFYDIKQEQFLAVMRQIDEAGCEVGMHSSYLAYRSLDRMNEEKRNLEQAFGKPIVGNRHHYWHVDPDKPYETAIMHGKIGLHYDSSIGLERHSGFRYGICSPLHLFDRPGGEQVSTLQIPPSLMDNHLFGYSEYNRFDNWRSHLDSLLHAVKNHEGLFVGDFHVRILNPLFFPGWKEACEYLLEIISDTDDFYHDTLANITRYWRDRECRIEADSRDETGS